jgi:hypothetical protein
MSSVSGSWLRRICTALTSSAARHASAAAPSNVIWNLRTPPNATDRGWLASMTHSSAP